MTWDVELERASFGDVEFDVEKTNDPLMRRWAEHRYPWKDGADVEDMGREPRRTTLAAIFLGEDASTDLGELMALIDKGETQTFVHPLFGTWQAKMRAPGIESSQAFRDGYRLDLEVLEDGTATDLPTVNSIDALELAVTADVSALEAAVSAVEDASEAWENATEAIEDAIEAVEDLASKAKSYASKVEQAMGKVRALVKKAKRAVDKVTSTPAALYDVGKCLMKTAASCYKLALAAMTSLPKLKSSTVKSATSTRLLAQALYGDASRVTEIELANTIRNPAMVRPGTALKVPSK